MKKLAIFTTSALVRFSFIGDISSVNKALKRMGYEILPYDFDAKSIGKDIFKIFNNFCSAAGANNAKKRTELKSLFFQNILAQSVPGIQQTLISLKKAGVKIALINHEYMLEEKLRQVNIDFKDFHFIDQSDVKKGTAAVLKKCLSWADQFDIERDEILFIGTKAHEYITALESKPIIDFLGASCGFKDDHFKDMGLPNERITSFGELSEKILNIACFEKVEMV